jgi:hypothetical protein
MSTMLDSYNIVEPHWISGMQHENMIRSGVALKPEVWDKLGRSSEFLIKQQRLNCGATQQSSSQRSLRES